MSVIDKLRGGDKRSIGRADEVAQEILKKPHLFKEVFLGMLDHDAIVRMRCADAVEKASSRNPELLKPFKNKLINEVAIVNQQEVMWHTAQLFSYLELSRAEAVRVIDILKSFIVNTKSSIVKVFSMQSMADLALKHESLKPEVKSVIKKLMLNAPPSIMSRGRKLLKLLD